MLAYYGFYYDPTYFLVIIAAIISLIAQAKVNSAYSKYSRVYSRTNLTGRQVCEILLRNKGIYDVSIERVSGRLTDHYDPTKKVLRLSDATYDSSSLAALGVAAHECGHVMQHADGYAPLTIRSTIAPVASVSSYASWGLILFGLLFGGTTGDTFLKIGIIAFTVVVLFQLITLPVEFDASKRALAMLGDNGILYGDEVKGAKKVLSSAALTYVAAAATAILQLLRLLIILGGRRRD
ncbi:MAG: zinc metallopeptidase [Lachnospiraceae bacterium]|nr:zinc metallopeptidase [Lachnospiraceae bacterium]